MKACGRMSFLIVTNLNMCQVVCLFKYKAILLQFIIFFSTNYVVIKLSVADKISTERKILGMPIN